MYRSRGSMIFSFFFYIVGIILMFVSIIFELSYPLRTFFHLIFIVSSICYLCAGRCPYCGRLGLCVRPFGKNAGYCCRCGALVEFDD